MSRKAFSQVFESFFTFHFKDTFGIWGLMENGFMGDPRDFFFFRVMTGGGVRMVDF